jgi:hypothetical protein
MTKSWFPDPPDAAPRGRECPPPHAGVQLHHPGLRPASERIRGNFGMSRDGCQSVDFPEFESTRPTSAKPSIPKDSSARPVFPAPARLQRLQIRIPRRLPLWPEDSLSSVKSARVSPSPRPDHRAIRNLTANTSCPCIVSRPCPPFPPYNADDIFDQSGVIGRSATTKMEPPFLRCTPFGGTPFAAKTDAAIASISCSYVNLACHKHGEVSMPVKKS